MLVLKRLAFFVAFFVYKDSVIIERCYLPSKAVWDKSFAEVEIHWCPPIPALREKAGGGHGVSHPVWHFILCSGSICRHSKVTSVAHRGPHQAKRACISEAVLALWKSKWVQNSFWEGCLQETAILALVYAAQPDSLLWSCLCSQARLLW